jgi:hypothetical protein
MHWHYARSLRLLLQFVRFPCPSFAFLFLFFFPLPLPFSYLLTGNCSVTEVESYIAAGFNVVVPKPFGLEDLRVVLEKYVVPYSETTAVSPLAAYKPQRGLSVAPAPTHIATVD